MKMSWAGLAMICFLSMQAWCAETLPYISSVSVGAGYSLEDDISITRLGIRKDSECKVLESSTGWLSGYYEASIGYWDQGGDHVYNFAFSPVFVYYFGSPDCNVQPYVEAGIGVSGVSDTKIGGRNMTSGFQFEDRLGVGIKTKNVDLSLRYMHYSNASIALPNDGIDMVVVTVGFHF